MTDFPIRIIVDDKQATAVLKRLTGELKKLETAANQNRASTKQLGTTLAKSGEQATRVAAAQGRMAASSRAAGKAADTATAAVRRQRTALETLSLRAGLAGRSISSSVTSAFAALPAAIGRATAALGIFAPLAAGAAVAGVAALVSNSIKLADQIGKTADKIGIGVEALQEYRYAADIAGVSTKTFDLGLQRFSRRFGEAVQGAGELKDTLRAYGIATRNADGSSRKLEDALDDYAEAIKNAGSEQEQLRLAFKAFDSEGAGLVNLFRLGKDGIASLRNEARALGLVFNTETVRGAEKTKDELTRLSSAVRLNLSRALLQLTPIILSAARAVNEKLVPAFVKAANFFGSDAFKPIDELKLKLIAAEAALASFEAQSARSQSAGLVSVPSFFELIGLQDGDAFEQRRKALLDDVADLKKLIAEREATAATFRTGGGGGGLSQDQLQAQKSLDSFIRDLQFAPKEIELQTQAVGKVGASAAGELARANAELQLQKILIQGNITASAEQSAQFKAAADAVAEATERFAAAQAKQQIDDLAKSLDAQIAQIETQTLAVDKSAGAQARANAQLQLSQTLQRDGATLTKEQADAFKELFDAIERTTNAQERANRARQIFLSIRGGEIEFAKDMDALADATERYGLSAEEAARKARDLRIALLEQETDASAGVERAMLKLEKEAGDAATFMESAFTSATDGMTDALSKFIETGQLDFKAFVADIHRELSRLAARQITSSLFGSGSDSGGVLGKLFNLGSKAAASYFGGGGGGGGGGGVTDATAGYASNISASDLFGFASGGSFTVGSNTGLGPNLGGVDNRLIAFRARDGERVTVTPQGGMSGDAVAGMPTVNQTVNIITRDRDSFQRNSDQWSAQLMAASQRAFSRNRAR